MNTIFQSPCCFQTPSVTLPDQVWPRNLTYPDYHPYYMNRGDNYKILYRNASINNQTVQVGEPIVIRF